MNAMGHVAPFRRSFIPRCCILMVGWASIFISPSVYAASSSTIRSVLEQDEDTSSAHTESQTEKKTTEQASKSEASSGDNATSDAQTPAAQPLSSTSLARTESETYRLLGLGGSILWEVGFSGLIRLRNEFFGSNISNSFYP